MSLGSGEAPGPLEDMSVLTPFKAEGTISINISAVCSGTRSGGQRGLTVLRGPPHAKPLPLHPALQVPYDAASDAVVEGKNVAIFEEDLAWERKRGSSEYAAWQRQQREALEMPPDGEAASGSNGNNDSNISAGRRRLARRLVAAAA
jgi:hypothetical protein